jgi:DNA-binding CsgD family transcriptional regulator
MLAGALVALGAPPPTIASHWLRSDDKANALASSIAAARRTLALGAIPESVTWFDNALALWHENPSPSSVSGRTLTSLALLADQAYSADRKYEKSIQVFEDILRHDSTVSAEERVELWLQLSLRCWQETGHEERNLPLSSVALGEAREALNQEMPTAKRVQLLSLFAINATVRYGLDDEAQDAVEQASELADDVPGERDWTLVIAERLIAATAGEPGAADAFVELMRDTRIEGEGLGWALLRALGLHDFAIEAGTQALSSISERGLDRSVGFGLESQLCGSLSAVGAWDAAQVRFSALRERVGPEPFAEWPTMAVQGWGALFARCGHPELARAHVTESLRWSVPFAMVPSLGPDALVQVELARIDNDPDSARTALTEALALVRGYHVAGFGESVAYAIGLEADFAFETGRADVGAASLADAWIAKLRGGLVAFPGRVRLYDLGVFLDQAEAERARLAGKDAPEGWERLAAHWHALPRPYHEAYCRYRAAFALLIAPTAANRKEAREEAARHLERSAQVCEDLGAVYLARAVAALRRSSGLRTPVEPAPKAENSASGLPSLTPREVEVLRLLVAGESNGQMAIRLGISVKTAGVHVSNILRKFDAVNRVEVAVRATRTGLLETTHDKRHGTSSRT